MKEKTKFLKSKGFKARVSITMVLWAAWFCFLILYLFVWAGGWGHSVLEGLAVIVVSIIVAGVLTAIMWASWGMNFAAEHPGLCEGEVKGEFKKHIDAYIDKRIDEKLKEKEK